MAIHMMTKEEAIQIRAALIQEQKALEQLRNAIMQKIAVIEKAYQLGKHDEQKKKSD